MPTFLDSVFGRKKPTSATARVELAKGEAALAEAPARIDRAKAAMTRVADMSDAEHEAAIAEVGAAERAVVRLEAQVADLHKVLAEALEAEAAAGRRARMDAARKASSSMEKLLSRFDDQAAALAATAREIEAIDAMVAEANYENDSARRAGLDALAPILTSEEQFRTEPGTMTPDTVHVEDGWRYRDRETGRWRSACVFVERNGKTVPQELGAEPYRKETIIPGEMRPGQRMASPTMTLALPPTRLGGEWHWPRRGA